jgi:hypothetical protein
MASESKVNELHYVYFIREVGSHYVKIGYSNDPDLRIGALQTGNPRPLEVMHLFTLTDRMTAQRIERTYQARYQKSHVRGEWFVLSASDLEDVKLSTEIANEAAKAERKVWHDRVRALVTRFKANGYDMAGIVPAYSEEA